MEIMMALIVLILWIGLTVTAWRRGWKSRALFPVLFLFVIVLFDIAFKIGLTQSPAKNIIGIAGFLWLIYLAFSYPKEGEKEVKEKEKEIEHKRPSISKYRITKEENKILTSKGNEISRIEWFLTKETKIKKCPNCSQAASIYALKCEKCGEWIDNEVFRKLINDDVELIKTKDLNIATPSLISLMLLKPMKAARQELENNEKTVDIVRQLFFCSYCYSSAVNLAAKKKKGRGGSLKTDINIAIISLTKSLIEERSTVELSDGIIKYMLDIFNQLDKINEEFPYAEGDPAASEFLVAQRMGEIIYNEKNTIYLNMELYTLHKLILAEYRKIFSKFFIVEEEDFDWKSIVEQKD